MNTTDERILIDQVRKSLVSLCSDHDLLIATFSEKVSAAEINQYCFEKGTTLSHLKENNHSLEQTFLTLIK
mgnify:CR=1 FL=1